MAKAPQKERRSIFFNPAIYTPTIKPHWFVQSPTPPEFQVRLGCNQLEPLICGSEYLPKLKEALENATKSIWISVWGFDPALPLKLGREEQSKPENRIGEVLKRVAQKGVDVRVLVFYNRLADTQEDTLTGYRYSDRLEKAALSAASAGLLDDGVTYATRWVSKALAGDCKNLQLLTRSGPGDGLAPDHAETQRELDELRRSQIYQIARRARLNWARHIPPSPDKHRWIKQVSEHERKLKARLSEEYHEQINRMRKEQEWSQTSELLLEYGATDHQKMILIDHSLPEQATALGFVQGFNLLTQYFDTPEHPYKNPDRLNLKKPPYQDIGVQVRGSVLVDLFHNFKASWNDNIGWLDGSAATTIDEPPPSPMKLARPGVPAQILRTWKTGGEYTIEAFYRQNLELFINEFIYVEDQYFRYPEFAQAILKRAKVLQEWGGSKKLYVFVVTNRNTIDANEAEQGSRADMLEVLNRGDLNVSDRAWKTQQQDQAKLHEVRQTMENAGVMVQIGILRTSDSETLMRPTGKTHYNSSMAYPLPTYEPYQQTAYEEIYVHSKFTLFDDACYTLGSANWNLRSMTSDTELNIAAEDAKGTRYIREALWGYHLNGIENLWKVKNDDSTRTQPADWFEQWGEVMEKNDARYSSHQPRIANLFAYHEKLKKKEPERLMRYLIPILALLTLSACDNPESPSMNLSDISCIPLDNNLYPEVPRQAVDDFHRALALAEPRGKAIDFTEVARG